MKADDEQKKIGAFSYHVLKGLEGEASFDRGKVRGSMLGTYVTEVFKAWNQDPISRSHEAGSRECIITSGFPIKTISVASSETNDKQAKLIGLPFKPSQIFVGRSAEIDSLRTLLTVGDRQVAVSATVEGLGGIGKTEVILQLIYQPDVLATYKTIVWLDGAGPLPPQWEKIASELGVKSQDSEPKLVLQTVEKELRRRGNPLIILDNASEWTPDVANLIPEDIALLVTTRTQGFGGNSFRHLELGVLSDESATNFLIQMVPALENDIALPQLVEILEGHALALELAGWNISYLGISADKYIQRLNKHQVDVNPALEATKYGKAVDACLSLTWDGLKHDASRTLWRRASLFAPTSAHRDLLQLSFTGDSETRYEFREMMRYADNSNSSLRTLLTDPEEFDNAYAELRSFHVLARVEGFNNERWAMHRLVREYGRERLKKGEVAFHAMSLSEWLRRPTLPLELEIPHLVATIMDSARYVSEFRGLNGSRSVGREIAVRSFTPSEVGLQFDSSQFIYYIRDQLQDPKALTMILQGLSDINEDVRIQSINLLENIGPIPEVLDGLASSLDDPDSRVRETAGRTLAEHGGDKTVSILSASVNNSKERASLAAVKALGLMGKKAHSALQEALRSENQSSRIEAALLLCEQEQQEGAQTLIDTIHSVSKREQGRFIDALGTAKDLKAVPTLVEFLSNEDHRIKAIRALGKIGDTSVYSGLVVFLKSEGDYGVGDAAKEVLTKETDYLTLKNALSSNEDLAIRNKIALLLCEQEQQEGSQILIDAIQSVPKEEQGRFIDALGTARDPKAVPTLVEFLSNEDHRIKAIRALGKIGDTSVYSGLVVFLKSEGDYGVGDAAKEVLTKETDYLTLKNALSSNEDLAIRNKIALLLCEQEQQEGSQILIDAIQSVPKEEQGRFIDALGTARDPKAVPIIVEFLSDEEHRIRAIRALGKIGDTSVYLNLFGLLEVDNDDVKCAVAEIIEKLDVSDGFSRVVATLSEPLDLSEN